MTVQYDVQGGGERDSSLCLCVLGHRGPRHDRRVYDVDSTTVPVLQPANPQLCTAVWCRVPLGVVCKAQYRLGVSVGDVKGGPPLSEGSTSAPGDSCRLLHIYSTAPNRVSTYKDISRVRPCNMLISRTVNEFRARLLRASLQ